MANSTIKVQTGARNGGNARWQDAFENGEPPHALAPEFWWESRVTNVDLRGPLATLVTEFDLTSETLINGRFRLALPTLGVAGVTLNLDFVREDGEDEAVVVAALIALVAGEALLDDVLVASEGEDPEVLRLTYVTGVTPVAATLEVDASITWTVTFGGTPANGDYETEFSEPSTTVTTTRSTTPSTNPDLATQHATDIEAETDLDVLVVDATAVGAVVTVTFLYGEGDGVTLSCTPSGGAATMEAEASTPGTVTYDADHATTVNLNDLHPGNEFPAPVLKLAGSMAVVDTAFPAATTFTVGDGDGADTLVTASAATPAANIYTVGATKAARQEPLNSFEPTLTVHHPLSVSYATGEIVVLIPFVGIPVG